MNKFSFLSLLIFISLLHYANSMEQSDEQKQQSLQNERNVKTKHVDETEAQKKLAYEKEKLARLQIQEMQLTLEQDELAEKKLLAEVSELKAAERREATQIEATDAAYEEEIESLQKEAENAAKALEEQLLPDQYKDTLSQFNNEINEKTEAFSIALQETAETAVLDDVIRAVALRLTIAAIEFTENNEEKASKKK
eukprot:g5912.t1